MQNTMLSGELLRVLVGWAAMSVIFFLGAGCFSSARLGLSESDPLIIYHDGVVESYDKKGMWLRTSNGDFVLKAGATKDPISIMFDDEYGDYVRLVLSREKIQRLTLQKVYMISGRSTWSLPGPRKHGSVEPENVTYSSRIGESAVVHLYFYRFSPMAQLNGDGTQDWTGEISFRQISETRLQGDLKLTMAGKVPFYEPGDEPEIRIELRFDATVSGEE